MAKALKIINSRITLILAGLIVVIFGFYVFSSSSTSGLKQPVEAQLKAIQIEDLATAYSYTSQAFQKSTSLDAFKRFVGDYSGLRNNQSIVFNKRGIKNGIGTINATLISRGGNGTAITYHLVKENDRWKIESMVLIPDSDDQPVEAANNTPTVNPNAPTTVATTPVTAEPANTTTPEPATTNTAQTKIYEDASNNYSLNYPATWNYTTSVDGVTVFHKTDNDNNQVLISIQAIDNSNNTRISVQQMVDKGEEVIKQRAGAYQVIEDSLLPPRANKNENYHGRYLVYSYTLDNDMSFKQLQVIYFKSPSRAQYVINYISPASEFDASLPTVREMIASFTVS